MRLSDHSKRFGRDPCSWLSFPDRRPQTSSSRHLEFRQIVTLERQSYYKAGASASFYRRLPAPIHIQVPSDSSLLSWLRHASRNLHIWSRLPPLRRSPIKASELRPPLVLGAGWSFNRVTSPSICAPFHKPFQQISILYQRVLLFGCALQLQLLVSHFSFHIPLLFLLLLFIL